MLGGDPPRAVSGWSAARNQGVKVGVVSEFLIPRRQHHHGGWVDFAFGLQGLADRLPGTVEQQVVQQLAIAKDQGREEIGQRKHDLKIIHVRQQQFAGLAQPRGASRTHCGQCRSVQEL